VPLVLSDRDAKFTANFWRHLTARLGTTLKYATTDHHHTVGLVERANRTATEAIRTLTFGHPEDWSKHLAIVEYTINNTAHSTTRHTPFEHDYGYAVPRLDGFANEQATVDNHIAEQKLNMHIMDDAMAAAREITANAAKHRHRVELNVGDYALLRADSIATDAERHHTTKLHAKYRGPFLVTTKMDFDNYRLQLPFHTKAHPVFHISELLPYTATNHEDMQRPELTADNHYIVQNNTKHRQRHGQRQYLVKWKGYPTSESTYEPWENLTNVEDLLLQYCSEHNLSFIHDQ